MADGDTEDPTDLDQQRAAFEAREAATRARQRVQPVPVPSTETKKVPEGGNRYDQYDDDAPDDGIALAERSRLNRQDAFYRSSVPGSIRLAALAHIYKTPDGPDVSPERKKINQEQREEYVRVLSDLAAYDQMPGYGTTMEALVSLQGQLEGTLIDPTSWIGWGARGATWLARTVKAGAQQGAIMAATDPVIQQLNVEAGVREKWDPVQTALSAGLGFGIGGLGHQLSEPWAGHTARWIGDTVGAPFGVAPLEARRTMASLAAWDPSYGSTFTAKERFWPGWGVPQEALELPNVRAGMNELDDLMRQIEAPAPKATAETAPAPAADERPPAPREPTLEERLGPGPEGSFEDALAAAKQAADDAHREANAARRERGEEPVRKTPTERQIEQAEQREKVLNEEVGGQLQALKDEGLERSDIDDIVKRYDRAAGEHPQVAFQRAVDDWAAEAEADAIRHIDGTDSVFWEEMAVFDRAYQADLERPIPAGEAQADFRKGNTTMMPEGARTQRPTGVGDIPFERQVDTQPASGRAAEPDDRTLPATEGAVGESRAATSGDGEPRGEAGAPGGERRVDVAKTEDNIAAARERMPDDVREDFDFLVAMGADRGNASASDERRFQELLNEYGGTRLATERTAQGEQTLMPGVEPITDRQRAEAGAKAPMRGGDAPMPAGGLFDEGARAQGDLLGRKIARGEAEAAAIAQRKRGGRLTEEQQRAPGGTPSAPKADPDKDLAIRSLQQMSMDLAEAFDIPVRQGRVAMRGAAGTYNLRSGVIRVNEVPDFEVVTHEIGHGLEQKAGAALTSFMNQPLYVNELKNLDYDPTQARVNEGFAEFIRMYVGNRNTALRWAPNFTNGFEAYMRTNHPEMLTKLTEASAAYRAYLDAPSVDAIGSVIRSKAEEPTATEKVAEALTRRELPNTVKSVMQTVYDGLLDDKAPIARAVRELAQIIAKRQGGPIDLKAADNPEILARLLERAQQGAVRNMIDGIYPYHQITAQGPSLANAISEAIGNPSTWGKWDPERKADFSTYLIAKRAEYLWRRFDDGYLINPPVAFSSADARMAINELEAAYPKFRLASEMVHQYSKNLNQKLVDAGIITRDLADTLAEQEFYVPFLRDMSDKPRAGSGTGAGAEGPGTTELVKRMRGSARDIKDPLESLMMQTFLAERTIRHNDLVLSFRDLARKAGTEGGKYVEEYPAHQAVKHTFNLSEAIRAKAKEIGYDPADAELFAASMGQVAGEDPLIGSFFKMERSTGGGEPIVFYKEGGELKAVRVMDSEEGHNLYKLLTAAPQPVADIWMHLVSGASSITRSSIVTNPTFMIANYIRDQVSAAILRPDYIPLVSGIKGIVDEVRQGQSAVLYGHAGGVSGGAATGPVERAAEAEIDALAKKGFRMQRLDFSSPTNFVKGLLEFSSLTEAGTRNSIFSTVFDAKKKQGLSDWEAMIEAAYQAQDLLDFSRHGSHTTKIRTLIPFLNAHLQGLDKARRTMIEPILNRHLWGNEAFVSDKAAYNNAIYAWLKAGGVGAGLGAVWAAINWDQESYRDASPYFKGTHFIVPMGDKIGLGPKPFELALGFTFGEYAFAALMKDDPRAARQFIEAAWESSSPPNVLTDIPLMKTFIELKLGKSMFTGRDIVPERLQGRPPEMQYTDRTSELAKWLGRNTGISPIKIEYGIGSEFGNWGRDLMTLSQGVSEDAPAASLDDTIFFRRFVKDPTRSSDVATRFWEFMGRTTGKFNQAVNAYDDLVKAGREDMAMDFLNKLKPAERIYVTMRSAGDDVGKPAFNADQKRLHPLIRAYDAATLLNNLRRELSENTFRDYATGTMVKMGPNARRDLLDNLRELGQMELRNALVISKEPGYADRPVLDPNDVMDRIRHISPQVANEIATRYAAAKIYSTAAVQAAYPKLSTDVLRQGSQADLRDLAYDAKAAGYEFQGERVKKPLKRRVEIPGRT